MTELQPIRIGTYSGAVFDLTIHGDFVGFIMHARSQGHIMAERLHIPYHAVAFILLPGPAEPKPAADVIHLVPKE